MRPGMSLTLFYYLIESPRHLRAIAICMSTPINRAIRFFFSSRRRHTRSYGDWSSDVCSSDLLQPGVGVADLVLQSGAVVQERLGLLSVAKQIFLGGFSSLQRVQILS